MKYPLCSIAQLSLHGIGKVLLADMMTCQACHRSELSGM